jgi:hypothetical protein
MADRELIDAYAAKGIFFDVHTKGELIAALTAVDLPDDAEVRLWPRNDDTEYAIGMVLAAGGQPDDPPSFVALHLEIVSDC